MEAIWPNVHVGEDSLFQCIREIRTALGDDRREMIKLVSGRGYLFGGRGNGWCSCHRPPRPRYRPIPQYGVATTWPAPSGGRCAGGALHRRRVCRRGIDFCAGSRIQGEATGYCGDAIVGTGHDPDIVRMAVNVTGSLTDGLARIDNIRVVTAQPVACVSVTTRGRACRRRRTWC